MEKVYHIYAKEECLYNNLNEEQFKNTWNTLKGMVGLLHTDYASEDLSLMKRSRAIEDIIERVENQKDVIHIDFIHTTRYN